MDTEAIAIELLDALDRGRTIPSVVERYPGFDWDDGYKVAADFSFHWRLIVGQPHVVGASDIEPLVGSLRDCEVTLRRDGATMDRGVGANALGHPATALVFLAEILSRQPRFTPLAAGEVITTGTLTAALPIRPDETWSSEYSGLPVTGLQLTFTD